MDPLTHYASIGWKEGRWPRQDFDTAYYLESNRDVAKSGINPLLHYVLFGKIEGRRSVPPCSTAEPQSFSRVRGHWRQLRERMARIPVLAQHLRPASAASHPVLRAEFDAEFYLTEYADITALGVDPLKHFLRFGWQEGRRPRRDFDTKYYLETNPDVAKSGMNPFLHYILTGKHEGRRSSPPPPSRALRALAARPPRERARDWQVTHLGDDLVGSTLQAALMPAAGAAGLLVVLSHDEYTQSAGGIQNCIGDEARAFAEHGWAHLHACPARPLPLLAAPADPSHFRILLTLDGVRLGTASWECLEDALSQSFLPGERHLVIHHLLGFAPELVRSLSTRGGFGKTVTWAHDFFTICDGYTLLRNDVEFCHAPPVSSGACMICCYGSERISHVQRIRELYTAIQPVVIAPSHPALEFWLGHAALPHSEAIVQPHCSVLFEGPIVAPPEDRLVRVAYLGGPVPHKGWDVFRRLASRCAGNYEFMHFGDQSGGDELIRFVPVRVTPSDRDRMVNALIQAGVDVVISWSLCYETFSFTTFEAIAAGAFVVAREAAGNVWPAVAMHGDGIALRSEQELLAYFESGKLAADLNRSRRRRGRLVAGTLAAAYLLSSAPAACGVAA
jgi:glycosyltransferase involved in cell wall biosynthesis